MRAAGLLQAVAGLRECFDDALVVRTGSPARVVPDLVTETGACSVHISAESTPFGRRRDSGVQSALPAGVPLVATGSPYAIGPGIIRTGQGSGYQVFTPFSRAWRAHGWPAPASRPSVDWVSGIESDPLPAPPAMDPALPPVTEQAAAHAWEAFRDKSLDDYHQNRDRPDLAGTSRLSVHLKFGTIHPRTILAGIGDRAGKGSFTFVTELAWREFYADVLWHHPTALWQDLRPAMAGMPYDDPDTDPAAAQGLRAWQQGRTGYPMVDAGMRQLLAEGWMHNRVRMLTASFLTKHLHVWWPHGARHFLQHLVDGDMASNNHGWQWVAGTGTDAAPYFRVFNPVTQGLKFDPGGDYVRRYLPELAHLPGSAAHEPWKRVDGYRYGYPQRIVDLAAARAEALARYENAKRSAPDRSDQRQARDW